MQGPTYRVFFLLDGSWDQNWCLLGQTKLVFRGFSFGRQKNSCNDSLLLRKRKKIRFTSCFDKRLAVDLVNRDNVVSLNPQLTDVDAIKVIVGLESTVNF